MWTRLTDFLSRHAEKIVLILAITLSIGSIVYYYRSGYIVAYGDAASHLNIARRVFDNLTPGLVQLGGTWAPLQHIMMLPLIWNDFMWHSGLAGAVVSALSFIGLAFYTFKLIFLLTGNRCAALLGALIIITNPNLLYLQSIPMGESLGLFFVVASASHLVNWTIRRNLASLIVAAALICLGALARFEIWPILLAEICFVIIVAYRDLTFREGEGSILAFSMLAGFGPLLWFIWSLIIFGDPLYFLHNQYSADIQGKMFNETSSSSFFAAKGNLLLSLKYYFIDVGIVNGHLVTSLAFLAALLILVKRKASNLALVSLVFSSVIVFEIFSLYSGTTSILLPQYSSGTILSARYGIWALPLITVLVGYLYTLKYIITRASLLIIIIGQLVLFTTSVPITLAEPISNTGKSGNFGVLAGQAVRDICDGKRVLISVSVYEPVVFYSRMPIKNFVYEGNAQYWKRALDNPTASIDCIVMTNDNSAPLDLVSTRLLKWDDLAIYFDLMYTKNNLSIYKRNEFLQ